MAEVLFGTRTIVENQTRVKIATFTTESRATIYDVVVRPDGTVNYGVNCRKVDTLPNNSPLAKLVKDTADRLKDKTVKLLNAPEGPEYNALWQELADETR